MSDLNTPEVTNQGDENLKDDATLLNAKDEPVVDEGEKNPLYNDEPKKDAAKDEPKDEPKKDGEDKDDPEKDKAEPDDKDFDSLDMPEDSLLTDADMERIVSQAKEQGLGKEAAQKQVEFANGLLKQSQERLNDRHKELSDGWVKEVRADKEIGGEKFDESIRLANKALKQFGTNEFIQSLQETKFGNNPEVVRIFARIGKAMDSDKLILGGDHTQPEKSMEELFYPGNANN